MPAAKPKRPVARPRQTAPIGGEATAFSLRQVAQAAQRAADQQRDRVVIVLDLTVGATVVNHGLGRKPTGATVTPTTANATWAWAMSGATDTQVTITCVGVTQPGATLEVF